MSCTGEVSTSNTDETVSIGNEKLYNIEFISELNFSGNDDVIIGWLGGITVDDSGRVYMADRRRDVIEVFEADTSYAGQIGRQGDGPGEFRSVGPMNLFDGKIYVLDTNRQLINIFTTDNLGFDRTINLDPAIWSNVENLAGARVSDFYVQNGDDILLEFSKLSSAEDRQLIYHLLNNGDRLENKPLIELKDAPIFADRSTGVALSMLLDFERRSLFAQGQNLNFYTAWTEEFKIDRYLPDGSMEFTLYTRIENIDFSRSEFIDSYSNETARNALQNAEFPDDWPVLKHFMVDDENRLWVSTIVEDFDIYEWWVLEASGELITKFDWPRDEPIEVIKNGKMYTRQTDEETGLQQIVRYGIEME
ncbi:MAG: 6-bladed beta-propeller [Bacteroidetes bacterium]|jgi:hypothetical protein|nr:6-bladed beta-propeller [Bacteroidota bacterium]